MYPPDCSSTRSSKERNVDPMYEFSACVGRSPIVDAITYLAVLTLVTYRMKENTIMINKHN